MENLFRLMLVRPAVAQDPENPSIDLTQESDYQNALRDALPGGRDAAEAVSRLYVESDEFLGDPADNEFAVELADLAARLDDLETDDELEGPTDRDDDNDHHEDEHHGSVAKAVEKAFGRPASDVVEDDAFQAMLRRLRDSITAIKVLQEEHSRPIEELTRQLRTAEVVVKVAAEESYGGGETLHRYRRRSVQLPVVPGFGSRLSTRDAEELLRAAGKRPSRNARQRWTSSSAGTRRCAARLPSSAPSKLVTSGSRPWKTATRSTHQSSCG